MNLVDEIAEELKMHIREKNAITSRELAVKFGIDDDDTFIRTRGLITKAMSEHNIPLGSQTSGDHAGYFVIDSELILKKKYDSLMRRASNVQKRAKLLVRNYNRFFNTEVKI